MLLLLHNCIPFKKRVLFLFTFFPKWVFQEPFIINYSNNIFINVQNICSPRIVTSIKNPCNPSGCVCAGLFACLSMYNCMSSFVIQCTIKNIVFRNNHYWEKCLSSLADSIFLLETRCSFWISSFCSIELPLPERWICHFGPLFDKQYHCYTVIESIVVHSTTFYICIYEQMLVLYLFEIKWNCTTLSNMDINKKKERSLREENRYKWI